MSESPIKQTMDEMFGRLTNAIWTRTEAEKQIGEYFVALRALARVMEDKDAGDEYLARLDGLDGKPGFLDSIRRTLRVSKKALTATEIRDVIQIEKRMDLSAYSNPMASIHTTIRRMKESGEVEEFINDKSEKSYRIVAGRGAITPPPKP
jgi:hypothetical protein